jgi:hypothetical protein
MTNDTNDKKPSDNGDDASPSIDVDEHLEQLSARFLELWREQVAATADGAHAASAIGRLYASLGADTTRMGEGFEAWGNLIGQMAMGQHPTGAATNPMGAAADAASAAAAANPLMAMMEQMAKTARELPANPFAAGVPFSPNMPNMADMANMAGMGMAANRAAGATNGGSAPDPSAAQKPEAAQKSEAAQAKAKDEAASSETKSKQADAGAVAGDQAPTPKGARKKTAAKKAAKGQGKDDQSTKPQTASTQKRKPKTGGAPATSDAHGSRDDELAELTRRIADLSETIAALEAGTEGTGGKPPKGD